MVLYEDSGRAKNYAAIFDTNFPESFHKVFKYVILNLIIDIRCLSGFPGGTVVENLPANAGDTGSSPGLGRSHRLRSN